MLNQNSERFVVLNSTNYHSWSQNMVVLCRQKGYSKFIEFAGFQEWYDEDHEPEEQEVRYRARKREIDASGFRDAEKLRDHEKLDTLFHSDLGRWSAAKAKAKESWKKEEEMARGLIQSAVSDQFKLKLRDLKTAFEMWAVLKSESQTHTLSVALLLVRQLVDLRIQSGEKLCTFLGRFEVLIDKLRDASDMFVIPPLLQCFLVICSLPSEYDFVAQSVSMASKDEINLEFLRAKFAIEDSRREAKSQKGGEAKPREEREKSEEANLGQEGRRKCADCDAALPRDAPRKHTRCKKCHSAYWNAKEKEKSDEKKGREEKAHSVVRVGNVMLSAGVGAGEMTSWVMDSGATTHLTNNMSDLSDARPSAVSIVGPVGERTKASLEGTVFLEISDGLDVHAIELQNALFSPDLRKKLMSVPRLTKSGVASVIFTADECLVVDGEVGYTGNLLLKGRRDESDLYVMSESLEEVQSLNTTAEQSSSLAQWHVKFGHMAKDDILRASKHYGFNISDPESAISCASCAKASIRRANFKKRPVPDELKAGDEIHSDLCGQIVPSSLGGKKYFVTFIDKESDFVFGKTIVRKSEVMEEFLAVRSYILTQIENRVKRFVSDGEGKYVSNDFQSYLKKKGIVHEQSPAYTPQRNGVSERKNLTIMNRVRAILIEKNVPSFLWGEAFNYLLYVMNRSVRKEEEMSRYEKLHGTKPSLKHIHEFATPVVFKNNSNERKKLEPKGVDGLYVGYNESNNTYRVYDIAKRRIVASRDVIFFPDRQHPLEGPSEIEIVQDEDGEFVWVDVDEEKLIEDEFEELVEVQSSRSQQLQQQPDQGAINNDNDDINIDDSVRNLIDPFVVAQSQAQQQQPMIGNSRYPERNRKQAQFFNFNAELVSPNLPDPQSFSEAMSAPDSDQWREAMKAELSALDAMKTWDDGVSRPSEAPVVDSRWVFKRKFRCDGSVEKHKARLVAKGFTQTHGVDYFETFAPVARLETIRYAVSLVASSPDLEIHHLDVNSAFLNSSLEDEIYMRLPTDLGGNVVQLRKSLYGLKQSPRCWNKEVTGYLLSLGFTQSVADPCLFISRCDSVLRIIVLWVDDCLVVGDFNDIADIKKALMAKYLMKDLGSLSQFVGLSIEKMENGIKVHQSAYLSRVLERFGVDDCAGLDTPSLIAPKDHPGSGQKFENVSIYRQAVGCLNYLANGTRPDISFSVSVVARKLSDPSVLDWINVKRILSYLKRTQNAGIFYSRAGSKLVGYSDASYAENAKGRKSTGGYVFMLNNGAVSWKSKKQSCVSISSAEAELISLSKAAQECIWLGKLETDLGVGLTPRLIYEDNQATIRLTKDYVYSDRSKHIDVRYFFCREKVMEGVIQVEYMPTEKMVADILTKCLGRLLHYRHAQSMGMIDL
jgi:hypothetical protein